MFPGELIMATIERQYLPPLNPEIYPNPFAPPMETLPQPRQEWPISSTDGGATGSATTRPEWRVAPPIFLQS